MSDVIQPYGALGHVANILGIRSCPKANMTCALMADRRPEMPSRHGDARHAETAAAAESIDAQLLSR